VSKSWYPAPEHRAHGVSICPAPLHTAHAEAAGGSHACATRARCWSYSRLRSASASTRRAAMTSWRVWGSASVGAESGCDARRSRRYAAVISAGVASGESASRS